MRSCPLFSPRSIAAIAKATLIALAVAASPRAAAAVTYPQILVDLHALRANVAVASFTVAPDGSIDRGSPQLFVGADRPMPLASTVKIVVLAAFAREVAAGRLDPSTPVRLEAWDRFYLPGTDGEAHPNAYAELGLATDELGFALEPARTVPLAIVARMMMRHSDNAAADLLAERVGSRAVRRTIRLAGLSGQGEPLSYLGLYLAAHNFEDGALDGRKLRRLERLRGEALAAHCRTFSERYADPEWRVRQLTWLLSTPPPSYDLQARLWRAIFPRGTVADYASILSRVAVRRFLSPEASDVMRAAMAVETAPESPLAEAYLKGGSLPGVLTIAFLGTPRVGTFAGQPRVSVVFYGGMPEAIWVPYEEELTPIALAVLLAVDEQAVADVARALR